MRRILAVEEHAETNARSRDHDVPVAVTVDVRGLQERSCLGGPAFPWEKLERLHALQRVVLPPADYAHHRQRLTAVSDPTFLQKHVVQTAITIEVEQHERRQRPDLR